MDAEKLAMGYIYEAMDQEKELLPPNLHLRSRGINFQAIGCDLGGKLEPSVVTWYSTPPSRPTPSEAKGVGPYKKKSMVFILKRTKNEPRS